VDSGCLRDAFVHSIGLCCGFLPLCTPLCNATQERDQGVEGGLDSLVIRLPRMRLHEHPEAIAARPVSGRKARRRNLGHKARRRIILANEARIEVDRLVTTSAQLIEHTLGQLTPDRSQRVRTTESWLNLDATSG
jgi:hypothetical protein